MEDTANKAMPGYIRLSEGRADITLSRPLEIDGAKISVLSLREPTVDDQLVAEKTGTSGEADRQYMANLCNISPTDIGRLPLRDFKRLQVAFTLFLD